MNKKITIAIIILIIAAAIGGAAYFLLPDADTKEESADNSNTNTTLYNASANKNSNKNTNKNSNKNTNVTKNDNENSNTNTTVDTEATNANTNTTSNANKNTTTATETAASSTYKNDKYGFSVKLPKGTEFLSDKEELGFYPFGETDSKDEEGYEGEWFVSVYSSKTKDDLITAQKEALQESSAKTETITINGLSATKAEISAANRRHPITAIYVEKNGRTFEIMDAGIADEAFETFYKSFKF